MEKAVDNWEGQPCAAKKSAAHHLLDPLPERAA